MQRVVMICDRCGKEYKPDYKRFDIHKVLRRICEDEDDGYLDLCVDCQKILDNWLDNHEMGYIDKTEYADPVVLNCLEDMEARR